MDAFLIKIDKETDQSEPNSKWMLFWGFLLRVRQPLHIMIQPSHSHDIKDTLAQDDSPPPARGHSVRLLACWLLACFIEIL